VFDPAPKRSDLDLFELTFRDEIAALQLDRLSTTLQRVYEKMPHYRRTFDNKGIHPNYLRSLPNRAALHVNRHRVSTSIGALSC
jgi:phenylacetate-CoA ligase